MTAILSWENAGDDAAVRNNIMKAIRFMSSSLFRYQPERAAVYMF
jgi:hypothetical protein